FEMADFIKYEQFRLEDGTFCRPEPVPNTIWADDLFMSVPFMLRMAEYTGDQSWYDDIAHQIVSFNSYLYDKKVNLYKHGWFSPDNETSIAFWARANGWVVWGIAEALEHMPEDHENYAEILRIFREHMKGIVSYQDNSGLWHQVLDKPESYLETSASAMYVIGLSRGLRNGWLDESFSQHALNGWRGLESRISEDGIVQGICRGTAIGHSFEFYFERETFPNDPRGLGAFMQAAIELDKWINSETR
ncbi:MAG: glycoside hydrolase family 88/105 protein, partial [Bacteroidales bacterium]